MPLNDVVLDMDKGRITYAALIPGAYMVPRILAVPFKTGSPGGALVVVVAEGQAWHVLFSRRPTLLYFDSALLSDRDDGGSGRILFLFYVASFFIFGALPKKHDALPETEAAAAAAA